MPHNHSPTTPPPIAPSYEQFKRSGSPSALTLLHLVFLLPEVQTYFSTALYNMLKGHLFATSTHPHLTYNFVLHSGRGAAVCGVCRWLLKADAQERAFMAEINALLEASTPADKPLTEDTSMGPVSLNVLVGVYFATCPL